MADNVPITAGSGTDVATDQVTGTGEHVQVVKLAIATDGSRTAIPADGTDGLLVNLGSNNDVSAAQSGTWTVQPGNTANTTAWLTTPIPNQYELAAGPTTHVKKYYTAATPTDGIVWSPAAGKRWYVTDMIINVSAASTVTLEDDQTGGDVVVFAAALAANSGIAHSFSTPLYSGEDAADLVITATAGTVYVTITGYEI